MLFISLANSIGFAARDSYLPNRENTLSYEERYSGISLNPIYLQKFDLTDVITIQLGSNVATVPTVDIYQPEKLAPIVPVLMSSYTGNLDVNDDRYYFEFEVDLSLFPGKTLQLKASQGTDVFLSEYFCAQDLSEDLSMGELLKLNYKNSEKPSDYTNFQIDYTTGIEFFFYIEGILRKPVPEGEDEVFSNLDRKVLLEAQLFRAKILETAPLPEYLTEKIMIAGKHFYFSINDIQHVTDGMPDIETSDSNFSILTWKGIQKDVLGFNTDNRAIGGEEMDTIIQRKNEAIVSTWSFIVPKEYMLHEIFASHNIASIATYSLKVGTTVGGDELLSYIIGEVPLSGAQNPLAFTIHQQLSYVADVPVYVEIQTSGGIADVRAQLILNM